MNGTANKFIEMVTDPLRSRYFLLTQLPAAFFSGVRIREVSTESSVITVPYTWFSRNPFRSTYFACLAMAGEMSTGILAMLHLYGRRPPVSMLIIGMNAEYFKKATDLTLFTCEGGFKLKESIERAVSSGEPVVCEVRSVGKNAKGELVAVFSFTWSFKVKA